LLYTIIHSIFDKSDFFLRSQLHLQISNMAWITQLIRSAFAIYVFLDMQYRNIPNYYSDLLQSFE